MSGRLEEMPGEEGYPHIFPEGFQVYEQAGRVVCLGSDERRGHLLQWRQCHLRWETYQSL